MADDVSKASAGDDRRWTDAGIEVRPLYGPGDLEGFDPSRDLGDPGLPPFTRGVYATMYRGRVWTMRQYAGMGTARETNERFRYLLDQGQTGLSVAFDLPDADGLRQRPSAGRGRGRQDGGRDRLGRRPAHAVRRDPAGPRDDLDDDQRDRADPAAALRAGGRGAGRHGGGARRDGPERPAQGVLGARHVHLPAEALDAPDHRPVRVLPRADAEVEHDLDQRLPHARGRLHRRPGGRVHARRRDRVRTGRVGRGPGDRQVRRRGCRSSSRAT